MIYLFDWGNTLMIDFPGIPGKMCDWDQVGAVEGAAATLAHLSLTAPIYVATGASQSNEADIKRAFQRVGLHSFISGYFCQTNTGATKGSPEFLETIVARLQTPVKKIRMVGDSLTKDIKPAAAMGIASFWLSDKRTRELPPQCIRISSLHELCKAKESQNR